MLRIAAGAWTLVLLAVGVLVSGALLGRGLDGRPVAQLPPDPPAVGSCVSDWVDPQVVPCDEEHLGEVVLAWNGEIPGPEVDLTSYPNDWFRPDDVLSYCWPFVAEFLGPDQVPDTAPGQQWWWPVPGNSPVVLRGPETVPRDDWVWSACVVVPSGTYGTSTDSLRGTADPRVPRPPDWRVCSTTPEVWTGQVPCTMPHRTELVAHGTIEQLPQAEIDRILGVAESLGRRTDSTFLDLTGILAEHPAAAAECRALAETYLGGSLAGRDSELRTVLAANGFLESGEGPDPNGSATTGLSVTCVVEVLGDRMVVDSLAGVGTGPLPYD